MKEELDHQTINLDNILEQIEEKKALSERYAQFVSADQENSPHFVVRWKMYYTKNLYINPRRAKH